MKRLGFRARLTATIASVFILGSAVLLTVQILLLQNIFNVEIGQVWNTGYGEEVTQTLRQLSETTLVRVDPESGDVLGWQIYDNTSEISALLSPQNPTAAAPGLVAPPGLVVGELFSGEAESHQITGFVTVTSFQDSVTHIARELNHSVMNQLILLSGIILLAAAGLAVAAASWVSKRSLNRIATITTATQAIGATDLHQRLNLTGPDDEIKSLGNTIDGMLGRIQDAFDRQDRFIASASHELRTPLTTTRTLLEMPLDQGLVPADIEPDIRGAFNATERGARLVSALLTLAQTKQSCQNTGETNAATNWSLLTQTLLTEREDRVAGSELILSAEISPDVLVTADADLLLLATGNLLDNAIRHNISGGKIFVVVGKNDAGAYLEVANDGANLTEIELATLLEPFNRGENTRIANADQGLGLGLTLVQSAADATNGELTLAARPQGGLSARLQLPSSR